MVVFFLVITSAWLNLGFHGGFCSRGGARQRSRQNLFRRLIKTLNKRARRRFVIFERAVDIPSMQSRIDLRSYRFQPFPRPSTMC